MSYKNRYKQRNPQHEQQRISVASKAHVGLKIKTRKILSQIRDRV